MTLSLSFHSVSLLPQSPLMPCPPTNGSCLQARYLGPLDPFQDVRALQSNWSISVVGIISQCENTCCSVWPLSLALSLRTTRLGRRPWLSFLMTSQVGNQDTAGFLSKTTREVNDTRSYEGSCSAWCDKVRTGVTLPFSFPVFVLASLLRRTQGQECRTNSRQTRGLGAGDGFQSNLGICQTIRLPAQSLKLVGSSVLFDTVRAEDNGFWGCFQRGPPTFLGLTCDSHRLSGF